MVPTSDITLRHHRRNITGSNDYPTPTPYIHLSSHHSSERDHPPLASSNSSIYLFQFSLNNNLRRQPHRHRHRHRFNRKHNHPKHPPSHRRPISTQPQLQPPPSPCNNQGITPICLCRWDSTPVGNKCPDGVLMSMRRFPGW